LFENKKQLNDCLGFGKKKTSKRLFVQSNVTNKTNKNVFSLTWLNL